MAIEVFGQREIEKSYIEAELRVCEITNMPFTDRVNIKNSGESIILSFLEYLKNHS